MPSLISIVMPMYNEQENIPELYRRLHAVADQVSPRRLEFVFVNDGSRDSTRLMLSDLASKDKRVRVINFSKNYGSHAALRAGLAYARGDAVIVLSADLQDPPEMIPALISKWLEGYEVVAGVRASRSDPLFKGLFAKVFYFLFSRLADTEYPKGGTDFFLIDRKIVKGLCQSVERNAFLMAQVFSLGFRRIEVPYHRTQRFAGSSKWTFGKRVKGAIDYFVAYSYFPIRLMSYVGLAVAGVGFVYAAFVVTNALTGHPSAGWSSLMVALLVLSGFQMLMLGVIGEYLWRTLDQVRQRPMYTISSTIGFDGEEQLGGIDWPVPESVKAHDGGMQQ